MRRIALRGLFFVALAFVISSAAPAFAQQEPALITVTGEAQVRVVPDEVVLHLGVETTNRSLPVAQEQNDERVRRVLALTRELGVEQRHVQTDFIHIEPWYRRGADVPDSLEYRVRKTIVVTLRDISKFEGMLARALEAGANHVHGVQFRTTELRRHRDQARALAIRAAREKAVALAQELGQRIGAAYRINEHSGWYSPYSWWGSYRGGGMAQNVIQESGGAAGSSDGAIALGQITVTANVTVSFLLEQVR